MTRTNSSIVWNDSIFRNYALLAVSAAMLTCGPAHAGATDANSMQPESDPNKEAIIGWLAREPGSVEAMGRLYALASVNRGTQWVETKVEYPLGHAEAFASSISEMLAAIQARTPHPASDEMRALAARAAASPSIPADEASAQQWAETLLSSLRDRQR